MLIVSVYCIDTLSYITIIIRPIKFDGRLDSDIYCDNIVPTNADRREITLQLWKARCATCSSGRFALERSPECSYCPEGFIPNEFKSGCGMCSDQSFAFEGDDRCQRPRLDQIVVQILRTFL